MATTRLFTIEDIEQNPPDGEWELIDGELVPMTPSGLDLSSLGMRIGRIVGNFVDANLLGEMMGSDGGYVLFPDRATIRVPDVAFIRRDRLPSEEERHRFPRLAPDLAIEVLSPSNSTGEVIAKIEMDQEAGIPLIWVLDRPEKRSRSSLRGCQPSS